MFNEIITDHKIGVKNSQTPDNQVMITELFFYIDVDARRCCSVCTHGTFFRQAEGRGSV